jgi:hypothetical protein
LIIFNAGEPGTQFHVYIITQICTNINIKEDKPMKKTYRLTIDYEIEINEKVQADGEYSRELIEKTQHILNAFFLVPDVIDEFNKNRLYTGFLDCDPWGNDMGEFLDIKEQEVFMSTLCRHLPPRTVQYFRELFYHVENYSITGKVLDEGLNLLVVQFRKPIPLNASFKEIGDINVLDIDEKANCPPGLENCKLVQSIIEFLHQGVKCA